MSLKDKLDSKYEKKDLGSNQKFSISGESKYILKDTRDNQKTTLYDIILKELNPKYDLEKIDKAKENDEFLKRCGYSILAPVKSFIRGTVVGAIVGSAYGLLTEGDPSKYVEYGAVIFGTADLAQISLHYFGNELIEDFRERRKNYKEKK